MSRPPAPGRVVNPAEGGWLDLCPADLAPGELRGFTVDARHVLVAESRGAVFALDDLCNHAGCELSTGWVDARRGAVVCPCHEMVFDLATGKNLTIPRLCDDQPTFPIKLEAGRVLVLLGS